MTEKPTETHKIEIISAWVRDSLTMKPFINFNVSGSKLLDMIKQRLGVEATQYELMEVMVTHGHRARVEKGEFYYNFNIRKTDCKKFVGKYKCALKLISSIDVDEQTRKDTTNTNETLTVISTGEDKKLSGDGL